MTVTVAVAATTAGMSRHMIFYLHPYFVSVYMHK